jgi:cystine transport system substrate-binding protein
MFNDFNLNRRITRSKFLRLFVLTGGSTALLVACGSNSTSSTAGSANPTASTTAQTASSGKPLVIGTEGTYPPFSFKDLQSGDLAGYDIEVAREVAKRIGREVEFVPTPWKSMLASLEAKRFDLVANQVGVTPAREASLLFSEPYTVSGARVIVSSDNPKNIQGPQDLKGKVVGTTQGSNFADQAKNAGATLKFYPGIAQVLTDLEQNRVDAALNDRIFVSTELAKANYKVKAVGDVFDKSVTAFAFHKDNKELRDEFNRGLQEIKSDGTLKAISKKWFNEDVSS